MNRTTQLTEEFEIIGGDFERAGEATMHIKRLLIDAAIPLEIVRRTVIACYEAEMNIVIYAEQGEMRLTVFDDRIKIEVEDTGPGIQSIESALREGFTTSSPETRERGFGAGMGLPNIKRNADSFSIDSQPGQGTVLWFDINYRKKQRDESGEKG
jgi:anti-sigma regulatory factor (Ser/Thr protein kinase)